MTLKKFERPCDGCTKCCEGWLSANINGHFMGRGRKCFFVKQGGCTIYKDRPKDPCVQYKCAWKIDNRIPEWFKPDVSNVIATWRTTQDQKCSYLEIIECDKKLDSSVLSWLIEFYFNQNVNIVYHINSQQFYIGSKEFSESYNKSS